MAQATEERSSASELLAIYLHDHRAGAAAGLQLARRSRKNAGSGDLAATLAWLETQIDEDRRTLDSIMVGLGIKQSQLKTALGVAAERAGRLKLNGRIWKRSPLSTLLELEALAGAVYTKRNLWQSLAAVAEQATVGDAQRLSVLIERADAQLERLQAHHADAARGAFDAAATGAAGGGTPSGDPTASTTTSEPVPAAQPPDEAIDRLLEDAEGGIEGSLLDAPSDLDGPAV
jgi:hypothetical protein